MHEPPEDLAIGVVIVAYESEDVLPCCLKSLAASTYPNLKIVVCDNASPDRSGDVVRQHAVDGAFLEIGAEDVAASSTRDLPPLVLIASDRNLGYGGGVNLGLTLLLQDPAVDFFWVLNPDTEVPPETAAIYALKAAGGEVGLMGGRVLFMEGANRIQSDGGRLDRWTGICRNMNFGEDPRRACAPAGGSVDYLMGANVVASRAFLECAGLMREDYFLYYEDVDWCARRGDMPLDLVPEAYVLHRGGTSIGTGNLSRRASPLSNYFNFRNRLRFMSRFHRTALPVAYLASFWRIIRLLSEGAGTEAFAAFCGLNQLPPPKGVAARIGRKRE